MNNCIERIKELELLFSDNQYNGSGEKSFVIEKGSIPVMISAPHAVNQFREGNIKWADIYTGGIARYLHEVTDCSVIYSCRFSMCDPNYDKENLNVYQQFLKKYIENHSVKLLLDLHGAEKNREYAIEMGTAPINDLDSKKVKEEDPSLQQYKYIDDIIRMIFEKHFRNLHTEKKEVWKNVIFDAGEQNTVTKFISENTETPCIQLEINRNYRNLENKEEFIELIDSLMEIVAYFSKMDWKADPQMILSKAYKEISSNE